MKIPDLVEIAVSWKRAFSPTPEQEVLADARIAVCNGCEHKKFVKLTRHYKCDACGCPLDGKVFSPKGPSACPEGKWVE